MLIIAVDICCEVKEKNVIFICFMFLDILGIMKNVEIFVIDEQLDKVLLNKVMFDGFFIEGFVCINELDMYLYLDLDIWIVFFWGDENGSVVGLICDVYIIEGELFVGDFCGNLKCVFCYMEEVGFKFFNFGLELEFFLFKLDENGDLIFEVNDKGGYFDLVFIDFVDNICCEIVNVLIKMGFEVEVSYYEVVVGQYEIDFKYDEVFCVCDKI